MNKSVTYSVPNSKLLREMEKTIEGRVSEEAYVALKKRLAPRPVEFSDDHDVPVLPKGRQTLSE